MDSTAIQTTGQVKQLTSSQARRLCEKIASAVHNLAELLWELRERKGWLALGYSSWNECCETEFKYSKRHANRLIEAKELKEQVGPVGPTLNERQARELAKVPEEKREQVLEWATEKSDGKPLTAAAFRKAADEVLEAEPDDVDEPEIEEDAEPELRVVAADEAHEEIDLQTTVETSDVTPKPHIRGASDKYIVAFKDHVREAIPAYRCLCLLANADVAAVLRAIADEWDGDFRGQADDGQEGTL
jgi:hypothetical protein